MTCYTTIVGEKDERWTIIDLYAPQKRSKKQTEYFKEIYNLQKINTRKDPAIWVGGVGGCRDFNTQYGT